MLLLRVGCWHLAVGPLQRETLLDVCLVVEARNVVSALAEGLRDWRKRAVPPTLTVTWDLP